ncbi:MAG: peptide-methionine (S)-S-oxide reductase MsrA [Synechococcaceae cyanobacterium]|nr:peptide-methionine (S)-S-oxide reductase MsrA [Synechococcaceae cyanobacterium]
MLNSLLFCGLLILQLAFAPIQTAQAATQEAVLAGGCFWCLEHDLERLPGVIRAVSGYSGGRLEKPTYQQVSAGGTGHQESVLVRFDDSRISYAELLRHYWRNIDPFNGSGQFCDRGDSYRPVIFSDDNSQAATARASLRAAARELGRPAAAVKVEIRPRQPFWPAEDYHQNYADRNPVRYGYYRWACGRDRRLEAVWGEQARRGVAWLSRPAAAKAIPSQADRSDAPAPSTPTAGSRQPRGNQQI